MLVAEKVKTLMSFGPKGLSVILANNGYKGASFKTANFIGITNGGQFCYSTTFYNENTGKDSKGKVFISYDHESDTIIAEY